MASRSRYISHKDFGALIGDLRLTSTIFQDQLLEFFERQRIVLPVARIRWPTALVIETREGIPTEPPTDRERLASQELTDALHLWDRFDADPELDHPLDRGDQWPGADLITVDIAGRPFQPWEDFRTNIRPDGEDPLYVTDAVDTYYHDWEVLLVADALDMGARLVFDTRQEDLMTLAVSGNIRDLPYDVAWTNVSFQGPRGLNQGLHWAPFLDASARAEVARTRKLNAIFRANHSERFILRGAELNDFNVSQKRAAERALATIGASPTQIVAFVTYLCERWDEWTRRGRKEVAEEYKRQILLAARMVMHVQDRNFSSLAEDVGRVTGHFANTLDVIFPDWTKQAREQADLSLKRRVVKEAPRADTALTLTDADVTDVLDWLERRGFWKVHLSIEAILARQFSGSPVNLAALAKEVESISTTLEHVVNALLEEGGVSSAGALMKKMQRFWNAVPEVHSILLTEHGLVSARATRDVQLANIAALPATGRNINVARTLLAAILYRNDGQHNAMAAWPEHELHGATRIFLTALMFCRKNLLANPPRP
jgi:hypothetical protein